MIRLLFLIRSLGAGGAERQLVELVKGLDKSRFAITVATFYSGGAFRRELDGLRNVRVVSLEKKGRWDVLPFVGRLWRVARRTRPHVIFSSMGISNELGLVGGRAVGAKVVWSLRTSDIDFSHYGWMSLWSFRVGALLSRFPDLIIANSHSGREYHIARGYYGERMFVIPNGIDTDTFRPDAEAGKRVRREWGIGEEEHVVGIVGRLVPVKDHPTFLRAAALLVGQGCAARFVCVGGGAGEYGTALRSLASSLGLDGRVVWAGARSDMPAVYNALDVACSSSIGEGLPNVVAEAMATGMPCVVTDVGDSARLVGQSGVVQMVVPKGNPEAMAAAWIGLLNLSPDERAALGRQARERILSEYSVAQLVRRTEAALLGLLH